MPHCKHKVYVYHNTRYPYRSGVGGGGAGGHRRQRTAARRTVVYPARPPGQPAHRTSTGDRQAAPVYSIKRHVHNYASSPTARRTAHNNRSGSRRPCPLTAVRASHSHSALTLTHTLTHSPTHPHSQPHSLTKAVDMGGATARRLGGRGPFEVNSFHATPIGIILKV